MALDAPLPSAPLFVLEDGWPWLKRRSNDSPICILRPRAAASTTIKLVGGGRNSDMRFILGDSPAGVRGHTAANTPLVESVSLDSEVTGQFVQPTTIGLVPEMWDSCSRPCPIDQRTGGLATFEAIRKAGFLT